MPNNTDVSHRWWALSGKPHKPERPLALLLIFDQYVGGTDSTVPFSSAPSAVLQALKLIQIRAQAVLGTKPQFNEILSAAYMERQKMAVRC